MPSDGSRSKSPTIWSPVCHRSALLQPSQVLTCRTAEDWDNNESAASSEQGESVGEMMAVSDLNDGDMQ